MKILKKSKSLRTKMNQNWLNNAEANHFWILWRFKILLRLIKTNNIIAIIYAPINASIPKTKLINPPIKIIKALNI